MRARICAHQAQWTAVGIVHSTVTVIARLVVCVNE